MLGTQNGKVSALHQEMETLSKSFSTLPLEPTVPAGIKATTDSQSQSPPSVRLHSIALRCIFDAIFPPSGFLDSALARDDQDSPWCCALRTRKALTLVCREWRATALPFLYGEVTLRRVGQLPGLASTIRSNPELFGPMIRSVSFAFFVPERYGQVSEECSAFILESCPNLHTLSFTSAFVDVRYGEAIRTQAINTLTPPEDPSSLAIPLPLPSSPSLSPSSHSNSTCSSSSSSSHLPLLNAIQCVASNITNFEFYSIDRAGGDGVPVSLMTSFTNVTQLTLSLTWTEAPKIDQLIRFEQLEYLCLWHTHVDECSCSSILPKLETPNLKQLCMHWLLDLPLREDNLIQFISKNGRLVEYLDLSRLMFWPLTQLETMRVASHSLAFIKHCPRLRHLVLEDRYTDGTIYEYLNDVLERVHVDVWAGPLGFPVDCKIWRMSLRLLDRSLGRCPDLPRLLPPVRRDQVTRTLPCTHGIFGMKILETDTLVTRCPLRFELGEGDEDWAGLRDLFEEWKFSEGDEDEEEGSVYEEPEGGAESTDTDGESDYDVTWSPDLEEQISEEEALAIFRSICQRSDDSAEVEDDSEDEGDGDEDDGTGDGV